MVHPTILIVEDHDALRKSLRNWLDITLPDCQFLEAQTGEEAVALVDAQLPDVVLMDISLPGMDGIEATRRIKAIAPKTSVVMISVYEEQVFQTNAAAAGASAFVCKLMMDTALVPIIQTLLSREEIGDQVAG